MSRWKAACIHLSISMVLAASIGALLYILWFPPPYFATAGATRLIILLMGVDIGIGPLLTLIVVNPAKSKKLLRLDFSVIAILQAIAFAYGIHVIAAARPVFVVGVVDRLVMVSAEQLADGDLARGSQPTFRHRSWAGPLVIGAQPSASSGAIDPLKVLETGKDIDQLPRFYVTYEQVLRGLLHHAKALSQLKNLTSDQRVRLAQLQSTVGNIPLLALPLQRGDHNYTAIVSATNGRPVAILAIDPW